MVYTSLRQDNTVEGVHMDYWEPAIAELKKVLAALEGVQGAGAAERAFFKHASLFGEGKTISDYPAWSDTLCTLADDLHRSGSDPLIARIAQLFSMLIREWEYGGMEEEGYRSALELSALASTLHERA